MAQTIIVSNRLPVSVKKVNGKLEFYPSDGGLAKGLASYANQIGTVWLGWPGIVSDELTNADKIAIRAGLAVYRCKPVFLTKQQVKDFYNGYSNTILWPHFHNMPQGRINREKVWKTYQEVNGLFVEAVIKLRGSKPRVWVHDYHLLLMPEILRGSLPDASVGFFLHIPFPPPKDFVKIPEAAILIKGLLGANLVGFHTKSYARNFIDTAQRLKLGVAGKDQVILADRTVSVANFPMGIDYTKFNAANKSADVKREKRKLQRKYRGLRVILTVDRLDPTKGFKERLKAYNKLLKKDPGLHGKVVMVMLAIPSREEIRAYAQLKDKVESLVATVNQTHGTVKWQPIHYMYKSVPFEYLSALYQIADVAFVAPIRDGMNLVAKEYIASQARKKGVLILSETAGAAEELADALLVNPKRQRTLVNALKKALVMPPEELKSRLDRMQTHLSTNAVHHWAGKFMKELQEATTRPWVPVNEAPPRSRFKRK